MKRCYPLLRNGLSKNGVMPPKVVENGRNKITSSLDRAKGQLERLRLLVTQNVVPNITTDLNINDFNNYIDVSAYFKQKSETAGLPLESERPAETEKREEERFYQRVQLSRYTQDLVGELEVNLKLLQSIDSHSKIKALTTHSESESCTNAAEKSEECKIEATVLILTELARLFTTQPESVMMAIRFHIHTLLPKVELQLKRLVPVTTITETTSSIPRSDLSFQYKRAASICHVLMGHSPPPNGRKGIRILTLDGGGSKGVVTLEILKAIERHANRPIHELFDYISGTSTGAILAFMVGVQKRRLSEVQDIYYDLSSEIWGKTTMIEGGTRLLKTHAYYDTSKMEEILQNIFGDMSLIESGIDRECPRISAISTLVNRSRSKPYLWRNYNFAGHGKLEKLPHPGTVDSEIWRALRASTAAPGFFEEFRREVQGVRIVHTKWDIHQDGGILVNNPAAVAVSECKALWPRHKIQSLVSIGTGRFEPVDGAMSRTKHTSFQDKVDLIVNSATNTHFVHSMMYETLPNSSYYRFNPFISIDASINVWKTEQLDALQKDARKYVEKNEHKFASCARGLDRMSHLEQKMHRLGARKKQQYAGW